MTTCLGPYLWVCGMFHILSNRTNCTMKYGGLQVSEKASMPPAVEIRVSVSTHDNQDTFSQPYCTSTVSARTSLLNANLGRGKGQSALAELCCPGPTWRIKGVPYPKRTSCLTTGKQEMSGRLPSASAKCPKHPEWSISLPNQLWQLRASRPVLMQVCYNSLSL